MNQSCAGRVVCLLGATLLVCLVGCEETSVSGPRLPARRGMFPPMVHGVVIDASSNKVIQ